MHDESNMAGAAIAGTSANSRPARVASHKRLIAVGFAVAVAIAAWAIWSYSQRLPKRFATVIDGQLYRSGEVSPAQLATLAREYGVKSVLSLLDPNDPDVKTEKAAAERLGMNWMNVPLRGNGASTPAQRDEMRRILLRDPLDGPMLVHCAAGTNRTGLACGMVRLHKHGWTLQQVMDEMRRFRFEDGPSHENLRAALRDEAERAARQRAGEPAPPAATNVADP